MIAKPTSLEGVWLLEPARWVDHRGAITQIWNKGDYIECRLRWGLPHPQWPESHQWVQENVTLSAQNVLRGIHGYADIWRLCSCLYGEIYLAVVNCDELGAGFGQHEMFKLRCPSSEVATIAEHMVLVPPKFGIGFMTLSPHSVFSYRWSGYFENSKQFAYRYDDPRFGIRWPSLHEFNYTTKEDMIVKPILSGRDRNAERLGAASLALPEIKVRKG